MKLAEPSSRNGRRSQIERPEYEALRNVLADALTAARMGQRELSRKLGKPSVYVNRILQGRRTLEFAELLDICEAIGADAGQIVTEALAMVDKKAIRTG